MVVNKLATDIYVVKNFVDQDDLVKIVDFASSLPEPSWYADNVPAFWYGKQYIEHNPKPLENVNLKIRSLFQSASYIANIQLQRHLIGHNMTVHRDNIGYIDGRDDTIAYGVVIYYNDNYNGGEIYYPELDIIYKPDAGDLVLHGSDIPHQTTEVIGCARYFSTSFIFQDKNTPVILDPNIFG